MNIIKSDLNEGLEHIQKRKEFIREITSRVFSVCEDANFFKGRKERLLRISERKKILQEKLSKYSSILERADKVKTDLVKKDEELDSYIHETKKRILKSLGSEL